MYKNRTYKIRCHIMVIVFFFLVNHLVFSQESILKKRITLEQKDISIKKALKQMEKQASCYFTYENSTLNNKKKVSFSFVEQTLEKCLDQLLNDSSLVYKVVSNHIIIRKKRIQREIETEKTDSIPNYIVLRGKLKDAEDGLELPFATISVYGTSLGVIANAQGEFVFKIPQKHYNNQLCFSHLGYENLFLSLSDIKDSINTIKLYRSFVPLQEVIIRKRDAKALIRSAIEKRKENYRTEPSYLIGFYRESVKKREDFMFFSEAVVKIYKTSYLTDLGDMAKILKSRKMEAISAEDTVIVKLKSGLKACFELDIAKNPINFLNQENFNDYEYNMSDIVSYNDRNAYAIEFKQKSYIHEALYQGKVYIDIEKLAFVGAEFEINKDNIKKTQSDFIARKKRRMKIRMNTIKYMVNYRLIDNTYYLNYVKGHLAMKVRKRKKLFPINFSTTFELAISQVDTMNVKKFKRKEAAKLTSIFFEEIQNYDEAFWEHYNFIKPDVPLQEAIKKLRRGY